MSASKATPRRFVARLWPRKTVVNQKVLRAFCKLKNPAVSLLKLPCFLAKAAIRAVCKRADCLSIAGRDPIGGVWYYPAMKRIDMILWLLKINFVALLSVVFLSFLKFAEIAPLGWSAVLVATFVAEFWLVLKIIQAVENRLAAINPIKRRKFFVFWCASVVGLCIAWVIPVVFELSGITRSLVGICTWASITTCYYVPLKMRCAS